MSKRYIHQPFDKTYKTLFSYPETLLHFLKAFVDENLAKNVVECELQKGDFVSKDYKAFTSDLIYKIKLKNNDEWMYIFILFEFKSQPVYYIALHLLNYICLFYVQLIKNWDRQNPLPPVLPIVIYNGDAKYDAPSNIYELIDSRAAIIKEYMPSFKYLCIDINTLDPKELKKLVEHTHNIAALLFEVEIVDEDMLHDEIHNLFEKVKDAIPSEILETLYLYFLSFLEPPRKLMKELLPLIKEKEFSMLATKIQNIRKKDYTKGLNEGIKKGLNEGIKKGLNEGIKKGLNEGMTKGKLEAKIEAFLRAFDRTNNLELSAEIAGFTIEEAQKILNERNKDK